MKKTLRVMVLVLAVVFTLSISVFAADTKYYVASDVNGYKNPDDNFLMKDIGNSIFAITAKIPAGSHAYKITNGTWDVDGCWGKDFCVDPKAVDAGMGSITLVTTEEKDISFYFNSSSKKIADSSFYTMVEPYIVSDFFSELGIGDDWAADKATTLLTDPEFDNIYTGTFKIPAGTYSFKTTIGKAWDTSYGIDGATSGMNGIPLEIKAEAEVTFTFDAKTHKTTFKVAGEKAVESDTKTETATTDTATTDTAPAENPKTGDPGILLSFMGLAAASAGMAILRKKK